ncbi:MAG: hypothetical protein HY369_00575 [Candidatus Aenigmarchaeota archaeon]|nr:hypothetical protein [Candidatus Aenigmarchaeota archaeon]
MSQSFDCPRCHHNQKDIVCPSDGFGYFVSDRAVEAAEFDLGIGDGKLLYWMRGKHRNPGVTDDVQPSPAVRCNDCGFIAAPDDAGIQIAGANETPESVQSEVQRLRDRDRQQSRALAAHQHRMEALRDTFAHEEVLDRYACEVDVLIDAEQWDAAWNRLSELRAEYGDDVRWVRRDQEICLFRPAAAPPVEHAIQEAKPTHRLVVVGLIGLKRAYLDIPREEALRRYMESEHEFTEAKIADNVLEFEFTDEFGVYDVYLEADPLASE